MRNCFAVFRNYGSQCDRSYAPTASQFDRNETHEIFVTVVNVCFFVKYLCYHRGGGATAAGVFKYVAAWQRCGEAFSSGGVATYLAIPSRRGSGAALILLKTYVAPQHRWYVFLELQRCGSGAFSAAMNISDLHIPHRFTELLLIRNACRPKYVRQNGFVLQFFLNNWG